MADLAAIFDHSTADDNDLGMGHADAWKKLSRILGQVEVGAGRPNTARIIYVDEDDTSGVDGALALITAATVPAGDRVIIQLGPGHFDGSKFAFSGFTDVIVRGMGEATVIDVAAGAAGNPSTSTGYPNSVRFDNNTRCGIEDMRIEWTDDVAQVAVAQEVIARKTNNNNTECWFKNLTVVVNEIDATRTSNTATVFAIGLVPCTSVGDPAWGLMVRDCTIISANSGMVLPAGETHIYNTDIWIANSARTSMPRVVGLDWKFGGRWYKWNGKTTTGYSIQDPSSSNAIYCLRGNQTDTDGVGWIFNNVMFARNEGSGAARAVYMNGATTSPWLRVVGSYLQAEGLSADTEAVETDWVPSEGTTDGNLVQLDSNIRIQGIKGNTVGKDGRAQFSASFSMPSSFNGTWIADGLSADVTVTLSSNAPVNNDEIYIKNADATYNVLVETDQAATDQLDRVVDGTITIPPGGMVKIVGNTLSGSDILFETMETNYLVITETVTWSISGAVANGTPVSPGFIASVAANETLSIVKVHGHLIGGTSIVCQIQDDDTNVTGATCTAAQTAASSGDIDVAVADASRIELDTSAATGSPTGLTCTLVMRRTVITKAV